MIYLDVAVLVTTPFGERLKELRDRRRLTQDGLASQVGVSRQTISNWETGTSAPNAVDLPPLARALRLTIAELYEDLPLEGPRAPGGRQQTGPSLDKVNVGGRVDDLRPLDTARLPIYRWGSLGDPRDHMSAPDPDRMDYPPLGRESLIGPHGFGVEVRGDSMAGRDIRDGDICWVNPDRPHRLGGVVLALIDDGAGETGMVVKTYARTEVGECLLSETESGKSPVICREYTIVGPVVWIQRGFPPR
jgi:transcriptional regulator with XRE-family HTH domain